MAARQNFIYSNTIGKAQNRTCSPTTSQITGHSGLNALEMQTAEPGKMPLVNGQEKA